jgi:hypothetical protein
MKFQALALLGFAACSTTSGVTNGMVHGSPCANDLVEGGYVQTRDEGEGLCRENAPAEITAAQNLVDGHYVATLQQGLAAIKGATDDQLACAKKDFDTASPGSRAFAIPDVCKVPTQP